MKEFKENRINENTKLYLITGVDTLNNLRHNFVVSTPDTVTMNEEFAYQSIIDSFNTNKEDPYTGMLAREEAYEEYGSQGGYKCYKDLGGITKYEHIEYTEVPRISNKYFGKVNKD